MLSYLKSYVIVGLTLVLFFNNIVESKIELSKSEKDALQIFRDTIIDNIPIQDYQKTDSYLIQWLKAQNYNISAAAEMFKNAQAWRRINKIDKILNETIELRSPGYVESMTGIDIDGHPIVTMSMKNLNLHKITMTGQTEKYLRYNFQIFEKMAEQARLISELSGEDIYQIYVIIDFKGYNIQQHGCSECFHALINWYSDALIYYPGLRFREVWINTPSSAKYLAEILRNEYSKLTNERFKIFGSNKIEWSKYLLKNIPSDQLTFQFGGNRFSKK